MNKHECRKSAQTAVQRVIDTRAQLREVVKNLPITAKMAAGKELNAALAAVDALADLVLVLNEEMKL